MWDPPPLAVGLRYTVTHLVPTQAKSWRPRTVEADVMLATTRTTWWSPGRVHST